MAAKKGRSSAGRGAGRPARRGKGKKGKKDPFVIRVSAAVKVAGTWHQAGSWDGPSDGEYVSQWTRGKTIQTVVRRRDGKPFQADMVRVEVVSPLLDYAHVVVPDCGRHYVLSRHSFTIRAKLYRVSGQNAGFPFFALADEAGDFLMGFGVVNAPGEVKIHRITPLISRHNALVGGDDLLTQHFEWAGPLGAARELAIETFLSEDEPTWFHALRKYTDAIKRREKLVYPANPGAWLPTWCTWTAWCSDNMSEATVLANARLAKELGMGTIILDDGWFGPGLDTDDKPLNLGDYQEDPAKFKDLRSLIAQVQGMGLKVLLWFASLPVARTSQAYQQMKQYAMHDGGQEYTSSNGLALLCPSCPEVRRYVADQVEMLLRRYNPDGFKVDLYNCLPHDPCSRPDHRHDIHDAVAAVEATMRELWQRVTSIKPDALLELKQDYGNVRMIRHGTMVRAGDTAYDSDTNTWRCFYTQAFAPVVHNDYLIASVLTRPQGLAQLLIRLVAAGVPTFGIDLPRLSQAQRDVIKAWLGFYHDQLAMFRKLREPQDNDFSAWQGGSARQAWVAALRTCREITLPKARRLFVINGTGRETLYLKDVAGRKVRATAYDYRLVKVGAGARTLKDGMRLAVPVGGMLEIETP